MVGLGSGPSERATGFDPDVMVCWDVRDERIDGFGAFALVRATDTYARRSGDQATRRS